MFWEGGFVPYRMPFNLEDERVCAARTSLLLVEFFSTASGSAKFNQTFSNIFLFGYLQDQKYWPLMPPLPSYGYGREHPGPRYGSLIHGQNLKDIVITGRCFSLYRLLLDSCHRCIFIKIESMTHKSRANLLR